MACHYGLVIYGDLRPFSAVPVDRHLFTSDQGRFVRTLERLTFSGGNPLRNCVTEGLSAAVDVSQASQGHASQTGGTLKADGAGGWIWGRGGDKDARRGVEDEGY